jgi:predicted ATPase/transcriptional regulator with XRE-family HTH domain
MPIERGFGQWLKQRRKALDLTQRDLAQRIGCALVTIQKIEEGERRPSKQIAALLADQLQIPPADRAEFLQMARQFAMPQVPQAELAPLPPPVVYPRTCPTNIPAPLTPLLGRGAEVATVCGLLLRADVRLVTLIGPPGVGKTRLSIAAARALVDQCAESGEQGVLTRSSNPEHQTLATHHSFVDGVWFVPLAAVRDLDLVISTIAHTLGVAEAGSAPIMQTLQTYLRPKSLLLVLDNFEQILEAAPQVAELLVACPNVKALVSSRAPLFVRGEHEVTLEPFDLPDPAHLCAPAELGDYPALALFAARVQSFQPTFTLTLENVRTVVEICARVDGLPLAIELAAARLRQFSLAQLAEHLRRPLPGALNLLTNGARDLPHRHQTLRNAVAWSYELLDPAAQHLFRTLSIFAGGFDYRAAAVVAAGMAQSRANHSSLIAMIQLLVDHRLVQQDEHADGMRYLLLETIREYAAEQLAASGELPRIERRHAEYFLHWVHATPLPVAGEQQKRRLDQLEQEHDNLRAALRWLLHHEPADALALVTGLGEFWFMRGYYAEGRQWLATALARTPGETLDRAKALLALGQLTHHQGDYPTAQAQLDQSLHLFQGLDDQPGIARALLQRGWLAYDQHNVQHALACFRESLQRFRHQGEELQTANVLNAIAHVLSQQGHPPGEIEPLLTESLALYRRLDHAPGIAHVLHNQGISASLAGDSARAMALLHEALTIHRQLGARRDIGWLLEAVGEAEWLQRNLPLARRHLTEGLQLFADLGDKWGLALALHHLAQVDRAEDRLEDALMRYRESLRLFADLKNRHMIARCLGGIGGVALKQGDGVRAAQLLGAAQAILDTLPPFLAPGDAQEYGQLIEQTRALLGNERFAEAWGVGTTLALEAAMQLAGV